MGLMNPFDRDNNLVFKGKVTQRATWNIVSRGDKQCLRIEGYSANNDNPSQNMIFEPHHIKEFESIIKAWRQEQ